jgi:hypothetical protein
MNAPMPARAIAALLLSSLLIGLAQIAVLPPFEGFDENGHYSYVQQVAETGYWPRWGDRMSAEADSYLAAAPGPDSIHPRWSHHDFFAAPADVTANARGMVHAARPPARGWTPGQVDNWQAQHPPLYYYLLAPLYLATKSLSLAGQLFWLRSASYLLAWLGLCLTAFAALRGAIPERAAVPVLFAVSAWPLLFPMWFPEMARMGNDSLVVVIAALLFILAWRVTTTDRLRDYALLGLVLGAGLLVKATLLPVMAAIFLVLALRVLRARGRADAFGPRLKGIAMALTVLAAVSAWWYVAKLIDTGSLIGSNDVIRMQASGGLIAGLMKNLRLENLIQIPATFVVSFLWAGTWSFIVPPRVTMVPLALLLAAAGYGAFRFMRRRGVHPVDGFAMLTVVLFLAALTYHSAVALSTGNGTSPAWYLHSLAPVFALLVGYGLTELLTSRLKWPMIALMVYPLAFLPAVWTMSALYYAGCASKLPGRLYFSAAQARECLADTPRMIDNLSVLAFPRLGIALFVAGWIVAAIAMVISVRALTQTSIVSTR